MSKLLQDVVSELTKLPSIGRRTSMRLALHMLRMEAYSVEQIAESILRFRRDVRFCAKCHNLSDDDLCEICVDAKRDSSLVCVVEQVGDLLSIEASRHFDGLYHVLGGVISPLHGVSPSDLNIDSLVERVASGEIRELVLAISSSVEGETTLFYIMNRLRDYPDVQITNIARGIGFGDELEYVDELTIAHALQNRRKIER